MLQKQPCNSDVPFTGPDRVRRLALALAAIGAHESNYAEKVVSCRYDGDPLPGWKPGRGRSITAFQLMRGRAWQGYTKDEICSSGPLAAYLAGAVLANYGRAPTALHVFQGYAAGDSSRRSKASARQCRLWERSGKIAGVALNCWAKP